MEHWARFWDTINEYGVFIGKWRRYGLGGCGECILVLHVIKSIKYYFMELMFLHNFYLSKWNDCQNFGCVCSNFLSLILQGFTDCHQQTLFKAIILWQVNFCILLLSKKCDFKNWKGKNTVQQNDHQRGMATNSNAKQIKEWVVFNMSSKKLVLSPKIMVDGLFQNIFIVSEFHWMTVQKLNTKTSEKKRNSLIWKIIRTKKCKPSKSYFRNWSPIPNLLRSHMLLGEYFEKKPSFWFSF